MLLQDDIADIERRLKQADLPLKRLYACAGINASTWNRWRSGAFSPQLRVWRKVQAGVAGLLSVSEQCTAASDNTAAHIREPSRDAAPRIDGLTSDAPGHREGAQ